MMELPSELVAQIRERQHLLDGARQALSPDDARRARRETTIGILTDLFEQRLLLPAPTSRSLATWFETDRQLLKLLDGCRLEAMSLDAWELTEDIGDFQQLLALNVAAVAREYVPKFLVSHSGLLATPASCDGSDELNAVAGASNAISLRDKEYEMAEKSYETIIVDRSGGVVRVMLNRPEKKNAANSTMWNELSDVMAEITRIADDRVLIISGAGGAFCSGADLTGARTDKHPLFDMDHIHGITLALHRLAIPTIACVDGDAVGAGCNLALGCDIVLATARSRFAEIFVRRGLSIDFGGSWLLPRLVGSHRAKMLCLTGELISARQAADIGLINEVYEPDEIEAAVDDLAERLVGGPPVAQALIKRLLNDGGLSSMAEALDAGSAAQVVKHGLRRRGGGARGLRLQARPQVHRWLGPLAHSLTRVTQRALQDRRPSARLGDLSAAAHGGRRRRAPLAPASSGQ